jgi:hypothetical protein
MVDSKYPVTYFWNERSPSSVALGMQGGMVHWVIELKIDPPQSST